MVFHVWILEKIDVILTWQYAVQSDDWLLRQILPYMELSDRPLGSLSRSMHEESHPDQAGSVH